MKPLAIVSALARAYPIHDGRGPVRANEPPRKRVCRRNYHVTVRHLDNRPYGDMTLHRGHEYVVVNGCIVKWGELWVTVPKDLFT